MCLTTIFIEITPWIGYSRYLRPNREHGRWGHELEEEEELKTRFLWVVRRGLRGEELDLSHMKTGKKRHQRNSKFKQLNGG